MGPWVNPITSCCPASSNGTNWWSDMTSRTNCWPMTHQQQSQQRLSSEFYSGMMYYITDFSVVICRHYLNCWFESTAMIFLNNDTIWIVLYYSFLVSPISDWDSAATPSANGAVPSGSVKLRPTERTSTTTTPSSSTFSAGTPTTCPNFDHLSSATFSGF